jgi:hypothetical protein
VLDRRSLEPVATVEIGPFGNTCDLLITSSADLKDDASRLSQDGAAI